VENTLSNPGAPQTITHEVAPMESIWRLAKMYEVSEKDIYAANRLKPGDPIQIGQKLVIPNAKALRNVVPLYANTNWKYVVVHHTATEIGKATLIHNSHHDRGFWYGLGYDFLIDNGTLGKGDGQIEVSPRWIKQQEGAHCKADGMNSKGIGVALVGNFNVEQPTSAQIKSLVYLTTTLCKYYRIPASRVVGHRDVPGAKTDCPGRNFPWGPFVRQLNL
jgi:N-acetylmuramoyl-L-alanine amidase